MILTKWGGSFLTNKGSGDAPRYRGAAAERLALVWVRALARERQPGLVVHGAGSFGHPQAVAAGLGKRRLEGLDLARAVSEVQGHVDDLQHRLAQTLRRARAAPTVLPARACVAARDDGFHIDAGPFRQAVAQGLQPLTGGDVVPDRNLGARILSGDEILHDLALALRPRRVLFVGDTDGVLDAQGRPIERLDEATASRLQRDLPASRDATGGMAGKLGWARRLSAAGFDVWIVNGNHPARVAALVAGRSTVGTQLAPSGI